MARRSRPRSRLAGFWLFLLGVLVGAGVLYLAWYDAPRRGAPSAPREDADREPAATARRSPRPRVHEENAPRNPRHGEETPRVHDPEKPAAGTPPPAGEPPAGRPGRVALVIDDLGRSVDDLLPLERLGVPITYSVLPFEERTPAVVAQLRGRGEEILLHLPMEPKSGANPGPGALRLGMTADELRQRTLAALQAVPGAVGVNNHMGSGLSADERSMSAILRVLSTRGLFFLDSRTSPDSVGYRTALSLGVPAAERQVFLDPDPRPQAVHEQFLRLLEVARTRGAAVAIGHPHPDTLAVLTAEVPRARAAGYEFVPVSYLLDRSGGPE